MWSSVNVTIDPELKEQLFNAEINRFACKRCGHEAFMPVSLLYHDMEGKFCIQFYPAEQLYEEDFYDNFTI